MGGKLLILIVATVLLPVLARVALANRVGIPFNSGRHGASCNACHTGGVPPTVTFQGPQSLSLGETGQFNFTVQSNRRNQQIAAGAGLSANGGQISPGPRLKEIKETGGEVTHTLPQTNDANDSVVFAFDWTAPLVPGTYTIFGAGNSVNLNDLMTGDASAVTTIMIVVGKSDSPTPTPTRTSPPPTVTRTSTRTLTPTRSPTASATRTTTVTSTVPTETSTPTLTPSVTATPTRALTPGEGNCDRRITAADLTLVTRLAVECQATCEIDSFCGVDVNRDQQIDLQDLDVLIRLLFGD